MNENAFVYDENTGQIVYTEPVDTLDQVGSIFDPTPEQIPEQSPEETPEQTPEEIEGDNLDVGISVTPSDQDGDILENPENVPEVTLEDEEETPQMAFPVTDDGSVPVVLNEDVTAAILNAMNPASGSIGSSTLDYFDRVASGLGRDYKYIAYRTDSTDSYDAVMYFGRDYDIFGNSIKFHDEAVELRVDRNNSAGNNQTYYYTVDASNTTVSFTQGSSVLYYTNAVEGFPVLGGYKGSDLSFSPFIVGGLLTALATVVLSKLLIKR